MKKSSPPTFAVLPKQPAPSAPTFVDLQRAAARTSSVDAWFFAFCLACSSLAVWQYASTDHAGTARDARPNAADVAAMVDPATSPGKVPLKQVHQVGDQS